MSFSIRPRSLFPTTMSPGANTTNRRTRRLKILPNAKAMTVELRMMTLYGMLKSGVGRLSKSDVVRRTPPPLMWIIAGLELDLISRVTYATSNPRFASGGYSVYLKILLSNSHVKLKVCSAGIVSRTSS